MYHEEHIGTVEDQFENEQEMALETLLDNFGRGLRFYYEYNDWCIIIDTLDNLYYEDARLLQEVFAFGISEIYHHYDEKNSMVCINVKTDLFFRSYLVHCYSSEDLYVKDKLFHHVREYDNDPERSLLDEYLHHQEEERFQQNRDMVDLTNFIQVLSI